MSKISILLTLATLISCTHPKNSQTPTGCRVNDNGDYKDYKSCFEGNNPDGSLKVRPEILSKVNFNPQKKWVSYTDFSRTQPKSAVHSAIVQGYILPNGRGHDVVFFDNGPDYFEEGLARFISVDGKTGFINEELQVAIPATHDYAAPFREGKAFYCDGCVLKGEGGHPEVTGGQWGIMDKQGKTLIGPVSKEKIFESPKPRNKKSSQK